MNSTKFYIGWGKYAVGVVTPDGIRTLPKRLDLYNHSPTGFAWGYGGSGPAQLALAILADCLGDDERAVRLHQTFKWKVTGGLRGPCWMISEDEVLTIAAEIDRPDAEEVAL